MEFHTFVRKPFMVEAIEITEENISDIAKELGELLAKPDGTPFIQIDPSRRVPNVDRVYIGYWMTKMGKNIRCYSDTVFKDQFTASTPDIEQWVNFLNKKPEVAPSV